MFPVQTSRGEAVVMDTALNEVMRPLFTHEPDEMKRRLRAGYSKDCHKILVGETGVTVSVAEYLYEDKYKDVLAMVKELLRRQDLAMFKRHPERLEIYIEASARKIIERAMQD